MNILLIDTTKSKFSSFVPLALLRLSAYHKSKGDNVQLIKAGKLPVKKPEIIYFSFIFLFNYIKNIRWVLTYQKHFPEAKIKIGGISPTLLKDVFAKYLQNVEIHTGRFTEIEKFTPDFKIAKIDYSYGFTSRGCINKCPFCVVPKLEGKPTIIKNWKAQIDINYKLFYAFDNNIFSLGHKHFENVVKHCAKHNIKIDFNQGLDANIFEKDENIRRVFIDYPKSFYKIRFAWDNDRVKKGILSVLDFFYNHKIQVDKFMLYMLYDAKDSPETVYKRIKTVFEHPADFEIKLMRFIDIKTGKLQRAWGATGDLFSNAAAFTVTGMVRHSEYWKYMLKSDLSEFLDKCIYLHDFIKEHRRKKLKTSKTKAFIEFVESRCLKNIL